MKTDYIIINNDKFQKIISVIDDITSAAVALAIAPVIILASSRKQTNQSYPLSSRHIFDF